MSLQPSQRQAIAEDLAAYVIGLGLNEVPACGYLGKSEHEKGKPHVVCFGHCGTLDATIRVWGPKFIHVRWQTMYGNLPPEDFRVFEDVIDAMEFIDLAFVKHEVDEAMMVPCKG